MMTRKMKTWLGEEKGLESPEAASGCQEWNPKKVEIRRIRSNVGFLEDTGW